MTAECLEMVHEFTSEQRAAIDRRDGELFLDAGAGSGKTSVLVERFARGVIDDGLDPRAILTITFTEKAAAEMRERIRERLRELGALDAARATESAFISTIHGFCARLVRAQALTAGVDPAFVVLDELEAGQLADRAFEGALVDAVDNVPGALGLLAGYGQWELRGAVGGIHNELRSRGERQPRLPTIAPAPDLDRLRSDVQAAAARLYAELRLIDAPSARVVQALERLDRVDDAVEAHDPWPGDLDALRLPQGNGAALSTDACAGYVAALEALRTASAHRWAEGAHPLLDRLLIGFGQRYERLKRERGGLDFEDLELLCRDLLRDHDELRERYRQRFQRVMVDELQDTNAVQLELIDMVSANNLFTVGDAQQSIYAFRHADVELFQRRGEAMAAQGERLTLRTNFRSRPEILAVINRVFEHELGPGFISLVAGREGGPVAGGAGDAVAGGAGGAVAGGALGLVEGSRVELLVVDREAEWTAEGPAAPWRVAEARALARRVGELLGDGTSASDVVVLTRATTDLRAYERALEGEGIATYMIGGRGYWSHPQVVDLVSYLRVLANPRDEEALYTLLASPLVGVCTDGLVILAAAARESGRDPWWVLREPEDRLDAVPAADREAMLGFAEWAATERVAAARLSVEALIERVLERTDYDLAVLRMPGGQRRLANVRKLMRLGRRHMADRGPGLRSFLDLVGLRGSSWFADPDASEAPVESDGLDAVRLMTIHRAKGLEFPVVCVADLGRGPRWGGELIRIGRDGRLGLRLARPGTGRREGALAYEDLGEEARIRGAAEERRLFYVAMTRAEERLVLSGAARVEAWGTANGGAPLSWLGPALVGDLSPGEGVSQGVRFSVVRPEDEADVAPLIPAIAPGPELGRAGAGADPASRDADAAARSAPAAPSPPPAPSPGSPVSAVCYTSLAAYGRCAYRFYAERILEIPPREIGAGRGETGVRPREAAASAVGTGTLPDSAPQAVLAAAERGTLVHLLLERLDFRRPVLPTPEAIRAAAPRELAPGEVEEIRALLERFRESGLRERLGRATRVLREQRFGFLLEGLLITGALDVIASEPGGRTLIVDYKTDRLGEADPSLLVSQEYGTQQLIYALAALRAGSEEVEVVHVFLEAPDSPVSATFTRDRLPELEMELGQRTRALRASRFPVTETPHRGVCQGCPAEGGLCSWPLEMTRRTAPDRLF